VDYSFVDIDKTTSDNGIMFPYDGYQINITML